MEGADAFTPVHIPSSMIHSSLWKPWPMEIDDKHYDLPIKHDDLPIKNKVIYPLKNWWSSPFKMVISPSNMVIFPYFPHENWWFPLQKWWFPAASHRVAQGTDTAAIPDEPPSDEMLEKLSQEKTRRETAMGWMNGWNNRGVVALWLMMVVNNG